MNQFFNISKIKPLFILICGMSKEELYELVRKDDVCLFVGSGFSAYSGLPLAGEIKDELLSEAGGDKAHLLDINKSLADFTLDYCTIFGRDRLISWLQKRFQQPTSSTYYHDLLSRISHFRTIITTNYDRLLENSYTKRALTIRNAKDVPLLRDNMVKIFKIHGDIGDPDSIVLTRDDYARMYNRDFKDPFWAAIIREFTTKHIIFLGYGYQDENVWADFNAIDQKIGKSSKRRIMIGRSLDEVKKQRLYQLGIEYIESSFETIIPELLENIKKHLPSDLRRGFVNSQIAQDFISNFDMDYTLQSRNSGCELLSVSKRNGETKYEVTFTTSDKSTIEAFKKFQNLETLEFELEGKRLKDFSFMTEGFEMLALDNLKSFGMAHSPNQSGACNISFPGTDFDFEDISYQAHAIPGKTVIIAKLHGFELMLTFNFAEGKDPDINFKITEPVENISVAKYIDVFQFLVHASTLQQIKISIVGGGESKISFKGMPGRENYIRNLEIFKSIKQIEQAFEFRFEGIRIADIGTNELETIIKLRNLIEKGYYAVKEDEGLDLLDLADDENLFQALENPVPAKSELYLERPFPSAVPLFGKELQLGVEQIALFEPRLIWLDRKARAARLLSSNRIIVYCYERFGFRKATNTMTVWTAKSK